MGIGAASATACSMVSANMAMVRDASAAANRLTGSQAQRRRTVPSAPRWMSLAAVTPPMRWVSSSASSRIVSIASSTAICPTSRPSGPTAGADARSYCSNR